MLIKEMDSLKDNIAVKRITYRDYFYLILMTKFF
jgi:hypothetical protein